MRMETEELGCQLDRPRGLEIIFSTAIITTLLGWWFLAR
jgi:hypothetical protein